MKNDSWATPNSNNDVIIFITYITFNQVLTLLNKNWKSAKRNICDELTLTDLN